jgi:SNF2 family DNA or RNA helicase
MNAVISEVDRYDFVRSEGKFPIELYPFQQKSVRELSALDRLALYFDVGTGKTLTSLAIAKYKLMTAMVDTVLIIVPPVLLTNWSRNIARLPNSTQVVYAGTPVQRKKLDLDKQFVIVGIQIFKRDYKYLVDHLGDKAVFGIVDEAQMLKNPGSDNFRKVRDFFVSKQLCLLTGTPMSVPEDAYALIKLVSPKVYATQYQFESIHVTERDFLSNKPKAYGNLDMLTRNLMLNAHRVLKEDVLHDLPELTYTPLYYDLEPEHLRLYQKLADEQMVKLTNGEKIDLTNVSALYQALQQIPNNAEHFSEGKVQSTVLDLIDEVLEELDGRKLVIFCHYRMTTQRLLKHLERFNAVALFGGTASSERQKNIDRFVEDANCKVIILQHKSGGAGIDSLQHVCRDILMVELPYRAADLHQAVARVHRAGQKNGVNCRIAIAQKTLQVRLWQFVQDNDSLINMVLRGPQDIRDAIAGR